MANINHFIAFSDLPEKLETLYREYTNHYLGQTNHSLNLLIFRWREKQPGLWAGVLSGRVWYLSQMSEKLYYKVFTKGSVYPVKNFPTTGIDKGSCLKFDDAKATDGESSSEILPFAMPDHSSSGLGDDDASEILRDYFQLHVSAGDLYGQWSSQDKNFAEKSRGLQGIRILKQDPVENLFSFICSSNNNIHRISGMVERLCNTYGEKIAEVSGESYYAFPTVDALCTSGTEKMLRDLGFGYRAKFIAQTASQIKAKNDANWLCSLREKSYDDAKKELMTLPGVGAKVLDNYDLACSNLYSCTYICGEYLCSCTVRIWA